MDYDLKDLSQAEAGRLKIEWASKSMPVLNLIKEKFKQTSLCEASVFLPAFT